MGISGTLREISWIGKFNFRYVVLARGGGAGVTFQKKTLDIIANGYVKTDRFSCHRTLNIYAERGSEDEMLYQNETCNCLDALSCS